MRKINIVNAIIAICLLAVSPALSIMVWFCGFYWIPAVALLVGFFPDPTPVSATLCTGIGEIFTNLGLSFTSSIENVLISKIIASNFTFIGFMFENVFARNVFLAIICIGASYFVHRKFSNKECSEIIDTPRSANGLLSLFSGKIKERVNDNAITSGNRKYTNPLDNMELTPKPTRTGKDIYLAPIDTSYDKDKDFGPEHYYQRKVDTLNQAEFDLFFNEENDYFDGLEHHIPCPYTDFIRSIYEPGTAIKPFMIMNQYHIRSKKITKPDMKYSDALRAFLNA